MELREYIAKTIREILKESQSYPFKLHVEEKQQYGAKYKVFNYSFEIDGIEYECAIYPNLWQKHYYDVSFQTKGGTTKDRVGKDFDFMNSVLKTVSDCMVDFINKTEVVKTIAFEGDRVRENSYVRFFKNHPYFSKFEIDNSHKYTGFVEIEINKGI